jgi:poly-gamma-glutamate synthesis protein (capsule biosynthesis protein)
MTVIKKMERLRNRPKNARPDVGDAASVMLGRRFLLKLSGVIPFGLLTTGTFVQTVLETSEQIDVMPSENTDLITIFLCGDVMTGRGIDQVLPYPSGPRICEPYMTSAYGYVELAEATHGPIAKPVGFSYVWGDALEEFERVQPDVRIINLETAVTKSTECAPKGINYKMNPENMPCITAARIDCCVLANNHVLDWGYAGLLETLETLDKANLRSTGAGRDLGQAEAPATIEIGGKGRVIVFSFGSVTSGIPSDWAASEDKPGVNLLRDLSSRTVGRIAETVREVKQPGGNWGYEISRQQKDFAHELIDEGQVDIVHGHSSHHAKGIEVYKGKPIFYGCGDFLDDYEGISGYEEFRDDLVLMYFVSFEPSSGRFVRLEMRPLQIRKFRLNLASRQDSRWLRDVLDREGSRLGTRVALNEDQTLSLIWQ